MLARVINDRLFLPQARLSDEIVKDRNLCAGIMEAGLDEDDPGKERRLRRQLKKDGYVLRKSRVRNPDAPAYGLYWIVDPTLNAIVAHGSHADGGMTLFEIEEWVNTPEQPH